jgi:predicted nucleotide-binding protein
MRKRRAARGAGGSRKEVVVVAGSMQSPVARSVVLDLERRGFIVYVIVDGAEGANMVKSEGKADILPLKMNVTDVSLVY